MCIFSDFGDVNCTLFLEDLLLSLVGSCFRLECRDLDLVDGESLWLVSEKETNFEYFLPTCFSFLPTPLKDCVV